MDISSWVAGTVDINILLSFGFGVIFIAIMLVFALKVPNPTPFAQWVFIVVVALAAAGVAAVIPGFLNINSPYVKAGGALAVFGIVFFLKPAIIGGVAKLVAPEESPLPAINEYLQRVDRLEMDAAWELLDGEAKRGVARDRDAYKRAYAGGRAHLGEPLDRIEAGLQEVRSPSGYPIGIYRLVAFRTRFASGQCHMETVSVRATDDVHWRVYEHNVSPMPVPCGESRRAPTASVGVFPA